MIVVVVIASLFVPGGDAISGLRLPGWTELRNRGDSSLSCSSRSYLFTACSSSMFVSRLFGKLRSKSASVEKRGDLTRITEFRSRILKDLCLNHRDSFTRISGETASNPADTPSSTARPLLAHRFATASHGLVIASDCCSPRDPRRDLVHEGLSAQGYY